MTEATLLDQQLTGRAIGLGDLGFCGVISQAIRQRASFLAEQGWLSGGGSA